MGLDYQESLSGISKSDLLDFVKSNFIGSRISVVGTGAVSGDALVSSRSPLEGTDPPPIPLEGRWCVA